MFKKTNSSNGIIRRSEMIKRPSQDLASGRSYLPAIASTPLVDRMSPRPFSPFYEESNLNLPRERMDVNAWARHYYDTDALIGNCIDLHSTYPLSSFGVRCAESMEVEQFFNRMLERLNFKTLIYDIAREYFIVGEVFPYCQLDEDTGEWSEIIIQNPDFIDVRKHILTSPVISLKPDAELQRIITSSDPDSLALRSQLDPELISYIQSGKNIPLENHLISHIARKSAPYQVRGTSILTRVYKDLMLRDIYREANFTIAANHVTPLRIVKVGAADGSYRPGTDELLAVRDMLEQATYDTNFTIITHTGFDLTYVGANGQLLDLSQEFEHIEDRILTGLFTSKAFTHGEGPCASSDTETLTESGWKFYDEITDADKIGTYNPENGNLEFHHYTGRVKFNVEADEKDPNMVLFQNDKIDHFVSLNHKVWIRDNKGSEYRKIRADEVKPTQRFLSHMGWDGKKETHIKVGSKNIPIHDYMKIVGLYLSEGSINFWNGQQNGVAISQAKLHKSGINERYDTIKEVIGRNYRYSEKQATRRSTMAKSYALAENVVLDSSHTSEGFYINDKELATHLLLVYGHGSSEKSIPTHIKQYSKDILQSLLDGCALGDGSMIGNKGSKSYEIYTVSKKMADDLQEIAIKCGYSSIVRVRKNRPGNRKNCYRVSVHMQENIKRGYEPMVSKKDIKKVPYTGFIYCFEVPNHLFVVRRNGKVVVTGNTYANASVALEVLQQRYVSFRNIIERWLERKVFAPISRIQDFTYYRNGIKQLIIPKVDWQKINLKNNREYQQALEGLVRDNKASLETLHEALDLDHQKEKKRILSEIDFQKEVAYKLQTPYMGKENINVSSPNKEDMGAPAAPGGAPAAGGGPNGGGGGPAGGGAPDLGGGGGGEGGLDLGGGAGGMDLGGGAEAGGVGTPPAPAGGM